MANLVIVESPFKINTIKSYLGSNYKVVASVGHVRDLPKSTLGIDIDNGFEPHYINIRGKGDVIKEIKSEAKKANKIFLATDPDREGEAISWHLAMALDIPMDKALRVTFNEITKSAVKSAIKSPRPMDMNLVNAQQTRRMLDRIVGYKISPFLWKTVKSGLSAGRVQSVATRIIVEREDAIKAFVPSEYWTIDALLSSDDKKSFVAHFYGDKNGKIKLHNQTEVDKVVNAIDGKTFNVLSVKNAVRKKMPSPPFTTSTMQQEASKKLGFQSAKIMKIAQELYEGINLGPSLGGAQGLITYMRTDSLRVSDDARNAARDFITEKYGKDYYPETPRVYKTKASAQDAHEAIRPARIELEPSIVRAYLTLDQYKLYKLIWERFIASQMQSAVLNTVTADFGCAGYVFRTSGYTVAFQGYMALYEESEDDTPVNADEPGELKNIKIPELKVGNMLNTLKIDPARHFTEPPPRYTEASLIKTLEEMGIGRPSTYTPIITTILARNYVSRDGKMLLPTYLGEVTTKLMKENFADIVDYKFTATMEDDLDLIEKGSRTMKEVLENFWNDIKEELDKASENLGSNIVKIPAEETDIVCEFCGSKMIVKNGRYGKFAACPNYPKCKNTKPLEDTKKEASAKEDKKAVKADFKCEKCGSDMVLRTSKYGSFYACSKYPECKFIKQKTKELDVKCPKCGSKIITKHGRNKTVFYSCEKYPECDFSSWDLPTVEKCPQCGKILFKKKGKSVLACADKDCGYKKEIKSDEQ